jgi:hypothetical protein
MPGSWFPPKFKTGINDSNPKNYSRCKTNKGVTRLNVIFHTTQTGKLSNIRNFHNG